MGHQRVEKDFLIKVENKFDLLQELNLVKLLNMVKQVSKEVMIKETDLFYLMNMNKLKSFLLPQEALSPKLKNLKKNLPFSFLITKE